MSQITQGHVAKLRDKVVAVSKGVANDINNITLGISKKIIVIYNPIAPPKEYLKQVKSNRKDKQIIWVGRLDQIKNPELMLEAFYRLLQTRAMSLIFIGDGPLRTRLEEKCEGIELSSRIKFLGYKQDPYKYIMDSDLLVLTSNQEGFGNVIVEAMHCGLRVVSTDCGQGIHEILNNGMYGTIVTKEDPQLLANAIEFELSMIYDPEKQIEGANRFLPNIIAQKFIQELKL
jgi:glycosyltransferase involved in cell wall biosynthesis